MCVCVCVCVCPVGGVWTILRTSRTESGRGGRRGGSRLRGHIGPVSCTTSSAPSRWVHVHKLTHTHIHIETHTHTHTLTSLQHYRETEIGERGVHIITHTCAHIAPTLEREGAREREKQLCWVIELLLSLVCFFACSIPGVCVSACVCVCLRVSVCVFVCVSVSLWVVVCVLMVLLMC